MEARKFTEKEREIIQKQILAKKEKSGKTKYPNDEELDYFIAQCERTGLDPFSRQIYGTWRGGKFQVECTIDGFRSRAETTGKYAGQSQPEWCDADGKWQDVWLNKEPPSAARISVKKVVGGTIIETTVVAHWDEYVPAFEDSKGNVKISPMWKKMGALMLSKVCEALGLRKTFPNELGGLYTAEEMMQADSPPVIEAPARPKQSEPAPNPDESNPPPPEEPDDKPEPISEEEVTDIKAGIKACGLTKIGQVANLFAAAGVEGFDKRSGKAMNARLEELGAEEAEAIRNELASMKKEEPEEESEAQDGAEGQAELAATGGSDDGHD